MSTFLNNHYTYTYIYINMYITQAVICSIICIDYLCWWTSAACGVPSKILSLNNKGWLKINRRESRNRDSSRSQWFQDNIGYFSRVSLEITSKRAVTSQALINLFSLDKKCGPRSLWIRARANRKYGTVLNETVNYCHSLKFSS